MAIDSRDDDRMAETLSAPLPAATRCTRDSRSRVMTWLTVAAPRTISAMPGAPGGNDRQIRGTERQVNKGHTRGPLRQRARQRDCRHGGADIAFAAEQHNALARFAPLQQGAREILDGAD